MNRDRRVGPQTSADRATARTLVAQRLASGQKRERRLPLAKVLEWPQERLSFALIETTFAHSRFEVAKTIPIVTAGQTESVIRAIADELRSFSGAYLCTRNLGSEYTGFVGHEETPRALMFIRMMEQSVPCHRGCAKSHGWVSAFRRAEDKNWC